MLRIGCGAGFSADRRDPACDLVARGALEGGVNASLNLDSHGKSGSSLILGLRLEIPDEARHG